MKKKLAVFAYILASLCANYATAQHREPIVAEGFPEKITQGRHCPKGTIPVGGGPRCDKYGEEEVCYDVTLPTCEPVTPKYK